MGKNRGQTVKAVWFSEKQKQMQNFVSAAFPPKRDQAHEYSEGRELDSVIQAAWEKTRN